MESKSGDLKNLVLNSREPLLFKNAIKSDVVRWNINDWQRILQKEELEFRCGKYSFTNEPQWERTTRTFKGQFEDFLNFCANETKTTKEWLYFDYKYLKEWFLNIKEIRNMDLGLTQFGLSSLSIDDFTIWIGSKGAHTPCHADTYGCNLIFQLYGRKRWVIFPPEENLRPTRVPYEESSIYSKLNFFSPRVEEFKNVNNCRNIILNPGDILLLPHKWWHYVENLETAISMNVWLPLPEDNKQRFNESLVQFFIKTLTQDLPEETKHIILNPNSRKDISESSVQTSIKIVEKCKEIYQDSTIKTIEENVNLTEALKKYTFIETIPIIPTADLAKFLDFQKVRFGGSCCDKEKMNNEDVINLINATTHPDVIDLIRDKYTK